MTDEPVVGRREQRERSASGEMERQKRPRVPERNPGRELRAPEESVTLLPSGPTDRTEPAGLQGGVGAGAEFHL